MKTRITIAIGLVVLAASPNSYANSVGRTQGRYATSPTGAATYSIPIWAPPGPHGVQPHIALAYNSQQGNGYVGVGWGVSGLSSIYRCNLTIAQDGAAAPIALATSDGYCMDGQRLRLTTASGTYGTAGSTYQTEIANFVNVEAFGAAGNGPAYWQATDRNGWHYTYGGGGTTSNAEVLASGSTTADSWQLNEVQDPNGNTMTISYLTSNVTGVVVPHVISWVPASAGSSSYNYTMTFSYGTTGSVHGYVGGTPFNNTNILSSIAIAYMGTAVKTYYLTYSNTTTATSRYLLTEVEECAGTGTTNCLAPTTVSWQAGAAGVGSGTARVGTVGSVITTAYDLNGDGRNDLVMNSSTGTMLVAFGGSSGYGTPVATGLSSTGAVGDIDGSGVDGFLVDVSGTWDYYKWNGSAFVGTSTGISVATAASPVLADLDGDGRADFVYTDSTGIVHVRLSTSTAGTVSFSTDINSGVGTSNFSIQAQFGGSNRALHFWGSAQADLLGTERTCAQYDAKGICIAYQYIYYTMHFTGSTFTVAGLFPAPLSSPNPAVDFADYNDDGCTDVLTATQLLLSACDGTAPVPVALPTGVTAVGGMDWNGDGRRDVLVAQSSGTLGVVLSTGTGLASTVINTSYSTSSIYYTSAPNLTGDGQDGLIGQNSAGTSLTYYLHNSPGAPPDLATKFSDGFGNSASPTYVSLATSSIFVKAADATYPYANFDGSMYAVSKTVFSDPSGTLPSGWNQTYAYGYPWVNLQGRGFQAFYDIQTLDSRNSLVDIEYYQRAFPYTGMNYHEILTQDQVHWINWRLDTDNYTTLSNPAATAGYQGRYFPYVQSTYSTQTEVGGTENNDPSAMEATSYTYDIYGNATNIVTTLTDNDPGSPYAGDTWTTTTTNTTDISVNPTTDLAQWCLTMLDESVVVYSSTINGSNTITRTKQFTPDTPANCRILTTITEPGNSHYQVTDTVTYDSFGNVATDTVSGINMPSSPASREVQMNWGTTGQFLTTLTFPIGTVAAPATATNRWSYTSGQSLTFGVPDSVKDVNGLTTSWGYDAFGRKSSELRPDGTSTKWTWSACTTNCGWSNSVYQVAQARYQTNGTTVIRTDTNSYDPVDRLTQSSEPIVATVAGTTATVQTVYTPMGLVYQKSMPFLSGATAYEQTYYYDILNRLTSVSRPVSSTNSTLQTTTYDYAGRKTTVYDPYHQAQTVVTDVNGWLRKTTDAIGTGYTITRAYDAAGSLTGITDSVGNTLLSNVTVAYGIKPFVTAATDADRGAWAYAVDSLGERTAWVDANGHGTSMTYDSRSRPVSRTEVDLYSEWNYGTTAPNVGRLTSECAQTSSTTNSCNAGTWLYSETRTYDTLARLSTRAITENGVTGNDPGGGFLYTLAYDPTTGLPSTLTYPKSSSTYALALQYGYVYGLLQTVTDTSDATNPSVCGATCVLWTGNAMDGFGHITQETLGNNVVTNRTYDAVTSWLKAATAGVSGGASLLNQSYLQDDNGNITQRQDGVHSLTESFSYDADNRLTCAALASTCSGSSFVYDGGSPGPGNITTQTGLGTYTYPVAGQPRPHAVSAITGTFNGITNPSFSYDANGNMTNRASSSQNIYWYTSNYPAGISGTDATGSEEVAFNYGPDRQRWEQVYIGPSGNETTYYVGNGNMPAPAQLEVVYNGSSAVFRHYIYAGSEPIALYSRSSSGTNTINYMLEDHQQSVSAIATSGGALNIDESLSAFGQRRNPSTWSGAPASGDLTTIAGISRQGFTFQTWLGQSMGLNHMNGRVEDAILGRFLSPDPHIPDPSNAQSYNRYSYVNNNPLTYTDPTGFVPRFCIPDNCSPGGFAGMPGEMGFCYGDCGGGGYDNSIYTSVSSTSPIGAFNNWVAQATGSAAQSQNPALDPNYFTGLANTAPASVLQSVWNTVTGAVAATWSDISSNASMVWGAIGSFVYNAYADSDTPLAGIGGVAAAEGTAGLLEGPAAGTVQAWSGTITSVAVPEGGMTAFRVWGGDTAQVGSWLSPIAPESSSAAQSLLSLPTGNTAEFLSTVQIPAGTQIQFGTAAPAFGQVGGGIQIQLLQRIPFSSFGSGVPFVP